MTAGSYERQPQKLDKSLLLSAPNGCSFHSVAAGKRTHLSVHHSMTEYEQEGGRVLKSDEGHTRTPVIYKLQI